MRITTNLENELAAQASFDLGKTRVDLNRLVTFNADPFGARWMCVEGSRRFGLRGRSLGTICLRSASGYEVVLLLDDGRIESFAPLSLLPDSEQQTTAA